MTLVCLELLDNVKNMLQVCGCVYPEVKWRKPESQRACCRAGKLKRLLSPPEEVKQGKKQRLHKRKVRLRGMLGSG